MITTGPCLGMHDCQVAIDGRARRSTQPKSRKLRMLAIPNRALAKHCAGQQRLPPKGDEPLAVKILGVKRPEAQGEL